MQKKTRRRSVSFPYVDLTSAVRLAEAIVGNAGRDYCTDVELAAWTRQSASSSFFRVQLYAARMFGIVAGTPASRCVTDLGRRIVTYQDAREARLTAFLNVRLYRTVFEFYKGSALPAAQEFERQLLEFGVSQSQAPRARQVLVRSADQAGFFERGKNQLVAPEISKDSETANQAYARTAFRATGDELIDAAIQRLPPKGQHWPIEDRVSWLRLIVQIFELSHGPVSEIKIAAESAPPPQVGKSARELARAKGRAKGAKP